MTVSLVRRLVWEGVVAPEEVQRALHAHVTRRVAFLKALAETRPELLDRLDAELGAKKGISVVPDPELTRGLPPGLSATLLAVPVGRNAAGAVLVAVANPNDAHAAAELSFHLKAPVELFVAPLRAVLAALEPRELRKSPRTATETPAFGVIRSASSLPPLGVIRPSPAEPIAEPPRSGLGDAPIPLIRVSAEPVQGPTTVKGVAPQGSLPVGRPSVPIVVGGRSASPAAAEPVIQLTRTKSIVPPSSRPPQSESPDTMAGIAPGSPRQSAGPPNPPHAPPEDAAAEDTSLEDLQKATSAESVASTLVRGLSRVARRVVVLAARGKVFEGREANDEAIRPAVRALVISGDRPSVLLTAVQTGQYVGPIPQTLVHQPLAEMLDVTADQEIAVGSVTVSGRAALVYVMAGFTTAYLATRRAEQLAQAARRALERIVRERKK